MNHSFSSEYWPHNQDLIPDVTLHDYPYYFPQWSDEGKSASASRSHSEAEKRRRDRINAQLSTLRKLIPSSEKMDKAALLGSVVEHVKDLKGRATEISEELNTPTDIDQVIVEEQNNNNMILKASFCCDDRPELFSELHRAFKNLKLTVMEADITSLGGRTKGVFVVRLRDNAAAKDVSLNSQKQSLRVVLCRIAISASTSNYKIKSKRQRFFFPAHFS